MTVSELPYGLNWIKNNGPLLTIARALFGPESFGAERVAHPNAYINSTGEDSDLTSVEQMPFVSLLSSMDNASYSLTTTDNFVNCVSNDNWNFGFLQSTLLDYVQTFIYLDVSSNPLSGPTYDDCIMNALEAAAFLANGLWLTSDPDATFTVSYDAGAGIQAPRISPAGIVLISTLLAVYLTALLSMAVYSNWDPHWTGRLDSFTIMQVGATVAEHLPPYVVGDIDKLEILDETSGWLGDALASKGEVGELALGARTSLRAGRGYRCFRHDWEMNDRKDRIDVQQALSGPRWLTASYQGHFVL